MSKASIWLIGFTMIWIRTVRRITLLIESHFHYWAYLRVFVLQSLLFCVQPIYDCWVAILLFRVVQSSSRWARDSQLFFIFDCLRKKCTESRQEMRLGKLVAVPKRILKSSTALIRTTVVCVWRLDKMEGENQFCVVRTFLVSVSSQRITSLLVLSFIWQV